MTKSDLQVGKSYLHIRQTIIDGIPRTAERWIKCEEVTSTGARFSRLYEPIIELTDREIEKELKETWEK